MHNLFLRPRKIWEKWVVLPKKKNIKKSFMHQFYFCFVEMLYDVCMSVWQ
jgi:hypothetical protein